MKRLIAFLTAVLLIAIMSAALCVGAAIYNACTELTVVPYFFQPDNLSSRRVGTPATIDDYGADKIFNMLVEKFVTEYFYSVPDTENISRRIAGSTAIRQLATASVFNIWKNTAAEEIKELVEDKAMRLVHIAGISLPQDSEYWVIKYKLATWMRPNDMFSGPVFTDGTMYMKINYQPGVRQRNPETGQTVDIAKYLEKGRDPAGIFKFMVIDVQDNR